MGVYIKARFNYDPDALAFIQASSIPQTTQKLAVNQLVLDLKAYGLWSKMKAIYPMVGGSAFYHKWNLKDPRDLDAAYRLNFVGGWTHDAAGITGNGVNNFADTFLIPNTNLSLNSTHISAYTRSDITVNAPLLSSENASTYNNGLYIWARQVSLLTSSVRINDDTSSSVSSPADIRGLHIATRTASNVKNYRFNQTQQFSLNITSTARNTSSIYLGASRNNANYNPSNLAFASIGDGLSNSECDNLYLAVQAFQIALGRSIGTQTVSDADAQAFVNAAVINDQIQAQAVNQLVIDMKAANIWTKMKAVYPFVGGTAASHKWNLKDPQDTNAAFRLTFNGGWTHSSTGAKPNGVNGYANTFLNPSTIASNNHLTFYSRTQTVGVEVEFASWSSLPDIFLQLRPSAFFISGATSSAASFTTTTDARGFWAGTKRANNDREIYRNGVSQATVTTTDTNNLPNFPLYIGARNYQNTSVEFPSNKECAFASAGDGLTDTEAANFYNMVQTFNTTLNRQV